HPPREERQQLTTATPRAPRTPARAEPVGGLIRDPRIMRRLHDAYAGHTTALQSLVGDVASGPAGAGERARRPGDPRARPAPGGCGTRRRDRRRGPGPSFLHAVYDSVDGLDQAEERQVVRDE